MPDMLVPLLTVPPSAPLIEELKSEGIVIRRAHPFELTPLREFCAKNFAVAWADEAAAGLVYKPVTTFIAVEDKKIVGFGSYECTRRNYFGPTGVAESHRKRNIGKALLLACLEGLRDMGYVYAIIGGAGPVDFYARCVNATVIPIAGDGIYTDMLW
jgi:GNAT superfamily N-acetyltransferase